MDTVSISGGLRSPAVVLVRMTSAVVVWLARAALTFLLLSAPCQAQRTVTYYLTDPAGTPLAEMDAAGNVTRFYDTQPYGKTALGSPDPSAAFGGHASDDEIGLIYMQARYFDPQVGRFLSVDPAEKPPIGGVFQTNRYQFGADNPTSYVDPDGRQEFLLSSNALEPRPLLPVAETTRSGVRSPVPSPSQMDEALRQAGGKPKPSANEWKPEVRQPEMPKELPQSAFKDIDGSIDLIKMLYYMARMMMHPTVVVGKETPTSPSPSGNPGQPDPSNPGPNPMPSPTPSPQQPAAPLPCDWRAGESCRA